MKSFAILTFVSFSFSPAFAGPCRRDVDPVSSTVCNGQKYVYNELAGYGFLAGDFRDKYGDTLGGMGSSIAIDKKSWKKDGDTWSGLLYALPDRGWNTQGTINYNPRVHKLTIEFTPNPTATVSNPSKPNIQFKYLDTILLKAPDGSPTTGLDADVTGGLQYPGFPLLPASTYAGDGFGGAGPGGKRVSLDTEGIFLAEDGSFWISDEYGPYFYHFDVTGKMITAVAPPDAILPVRNGTVSFSANSPPRYDTSKTANPTNPSQGRQNNQGFEGLTVSPDGKTLYVLLQSAAWQEGGSKSSTRMNTRFLKYDISGSAPKYLSEWVVQLPTYINANNDTRVAAQSEVHYVSDTQFLILARDSGAGRATGSTTSIYRHVDVIDISSATDVHGPTYDSFNASIASTAGVLKSAITPATYCPFLNYNNNTQLNRFGVHNGGADDSGLLNEKWESLAILPSEKEDEYYLATISDNDFITQNGYVNGGQVQYKDASGVSTDNQCLFFKITLPKGSKPLLG